MDLFGALDGTSADGATIPRDVAQMLIEKLDRRFISPTEARSFVAENCRIRLNETTRDGLARAIGRRMAPLA